MRERKSLNRNNSIIYYYQISTISHDNFVGPPLYIYIPPPFSLYMYIDVAHAQSYKTNPQHCVDPKKGREYTQCRTS